MQMLGSQFSGLHDSKELLNPWKVPNVYPDYDHEEKNIRYP